MSMPLIIPKVNNALRPVRWDAVHTKKEIELLSPSRDRRSHLLVEAIDVSALIQFPNKAHIDKVLRLGDFCLGVRLR